MTRLNVSCSLRLAEGRAGQPLAFRLEAGADGREQRALLCPHILLRLAQRGLRGVDIGIGLQRLLDQAVEWLRAKQSPPVAGNVALRFEMLRLAAARVGGRGLRAQRLRRVATVCRWRGTVEIRTNRATGHGERDA